MTILRTRLLCIYLLLAGLLLLVVYPIAALPMARFSLEYDVSLPGMAIVGLLSIPAIAVVRWRPTRWLGIVVSVFLLTLVIAVVSTSFSMEAVELMARVLVPLAVAGAVCELPLAWRRYMIWVLGIYWLTQVSSGFLSLARGYEVIGIAGNRNWMAALLLMTAPWAMATILDLLSGLRRRRLAVTCSVVLVLVPTLWLLAAASSRAAWLALGVLLFWFLWMIFSWRLRILLGVLMSLIMVSILILHTDTVIRTMKDDVRLPIIGRTVAMMSDYDVLTAAAEAVMTRSLTPFREMRNVSGVGPGNYRRDFTPYRAQSTYGQRLNAAATTIHPHNELLNIGAQIGLLGALAWLALLWPVIQKPVWPSTFHGVAKVSALLVFTHGMFDMTLVQAPVSYAALIVLGICWTPHMRLPVHGEGKDGAWISSRAAVLALATVMVGLVVVVSVQDVRSDVLMRRTELLKRVGRNAEAAELYGRALEISNDIGALYRLGAMQVEYLEQPEAAIETLQKVVEQDPNYAHVHSLLAFAYLLRGKLGPALEHALRECQLYQYDAVAWQKYFSYLAAANERTGMVKVGERIDALYLEKALLRRSKDDLREILERWQVAVADGAEEAAIAAAEEACLHLQITFLDPLFQFLAGDTALPSSFLYDRFNTSDYAYWRQLLFAMELLGALPETESPGEELQRLVQGFSRQLKIEPGIKEFRYLDQAWREEAVNPMSAYCALSFVLRSRGWWMDIAVDAQGQPVSGIARGFGQVVECRLTDGSVRPLEPDQVKEIGQRHLSFFYFQEFFLKNRILGLLCRHALETFPIGFDHYPTLRLWNHRAELTPQSVPPFLSLPNYCVQDQFHHIAARLGQVQEPSPE